MKQKAKVLERKAKQKHEKAEKEREKAKTEHQIARGENLIAEEHNENEEHRDKGDKHLHQAEIEEEKAWKARMRAEQLMTQAKVYQELHVNSNRKHKRNLVRSGKSYFNDSEKNKRTPGISNAYRNLMSKVTQPVTHKRVASQIAQMRVKRQNLTPQNEANQKNLKLHKKDQKDPTT